MRKLVTGLLPALLLAACGGAPPAEPESGDSAQVEAVSSEQLGLAKVSVFDQSDPIVAQAAGGEPGDNAVAGGAFEGAPPTIPHLVSDYLPISIEENACLECLHAPEALGEPVAAGDPPPIPASHYRDLRQGADEAEGRVDGARYNCTQCHAAQTDAQPLVENVWALK